MPRIKDKIIINNEQETADYNAIHAQHGLLLQQANEIEAKGKLDQTGPFVDRMRALCKTKAQANRDYLDGLRQLTEDLHTFVDSN
jgi:hypothetical protein